MQTKKVSTYYGITVDAKLAIISNLHVELKRQGVSEKALHELMQLAGWARVGDRWNLFTDNGINYRLLDVEDPDKVRLLAKALTMTQDKYQDYSLYINDTKARELLVILDDVQIRLQTLSGINKALNLAERGFLKTHSEIAERLDPLTNRILESYKDVDEEISFDVTVEALRSLWQHKRG